MQGKSLYPILSRKEDPAFHKPYVISEFHDALDRPNRSHGSMYFDGRYKICVYHGTDVGEIYDLEDDPGEFRNLWDEANYQELKLKLLKKHFDAMMATSSPGIQRSGPY